MMRRIVVILFLALLAIAISACSAYQPSLRLENMPQRYQQFDLVLGWDTRVVDGQTVIEGVAKNVRFAFMNDLEIWVYVLDEAGRAVTHGMTFVIPSQLRMDETTEFAIRLPVRAEPGTRLRFTYKYRGNDGGDDSPFGLSIGLRRGTDWMQSFDAVVPAGSAPPPAQPGSL